MAPMRGQQTVEAPHNDPAGAQARWQGSGSEPATGVGGSAMTPQKGLRWAPLLAVGFVSLSLGCRTVPPQPAFDLSQPGWNVRQGQAVWRTESGGPEIAGELLVAISSDGRSFVQFTKVPLPLVQAQATSRFWQIEFAAEGKRHSGRGAPPSRLVWFQLVRALNGNEPAGGWRFAPKPDGHWHVEQLSTGEILEGYLAPASQGSQ
jgi:hypothetical protein